MKVYFYTPTQISYIDLISIGGSEKEGDESTIGQFHTGLKNAIALFIRNNISINFNVYGDEDFTYTPEIFTKHDLSTNKTKDLICFKRSDGQVFESSVSPKLGIDWELFMALREIYANMLDEGGYYSTEKENISFGTEIVIDFEVGSEFHRIWEERGRYINESEPLYKIDSVDILSNNEGFLRIYKQNMLVYEDKNKKSKYAYNIHFGQLDDRRKLRDFTEESKRIMGRIASTTDENFINEIVSSDPSFLKGDFLNNDSFYVYYVSKELKSKIENVYEEFGEVYSFTNILNFIKNQDDCKISGRKIRTLTDSIWGSSEVAVVDMSVKEIEEKPTEKSLIEQIESLYNINISCKVIKGNITGSSCVADKHNKVIILSEDFDLSKDFHKFVIQYYDLIEGGNIVQLLAKKIVNLISK